MFYFIIMFSGFFVIVYLIFQILRIVWKSNIIAKILLLVTGGYISYALAIEIWPPDLFYIEEFQYKTGVDLPNSVILLSKSSTYPDFQGDYMSEAVFKIDSSFSEELVRNLSSDPDVACSDTTMVRERLQADVFPMNCDTIERGGDFYFKWTLYSDRETLHYVFYQT